MLTHEQVSRPPERVDQLLIPASALHTTIYGLAMGREREMLCYWLGCEVSASTGGQSRAVVLNVAFPQIESSYASFRLIDGQMSRVTDWCSQNGLWVLGQVHTHPTDEPHSEADECWPASRRPGFLSVVLPYFAQFSSLREPNWRVHEITALGEWTEVDPSKRFRVMSDVWLPSLAQSTGD